MSLTVLADFFGGPGLRHVDFHDDGNYRWMEMGPVWRTIIFRLNFHLKQEGTCFNSPVRPAGELMNAGGSLSDQDAVEIEVLQHHVCRLRNLRQTVCGAAGGILNGWAFWPNCLFLQFHRGADP
jgi:hypothetical protein